MHHPTPPPSLHTPRLHLIRLTNTTPNSQHLQWFHENWSNAAATSWRYDASLPCPSQIPSQHALAFLVVLKQRSLRGRTKSVEESRALMEQQVVEEGNWFYSVFLRPEEEQEQGLGLGEHIGSISLRHPPTGPELPPPSTFADAPEIGAGTPLSTSELHAREGIWITKNLNLRTLGYALFPPFWGKGYATEAGRGLLDAYAAAIDEWRRASKDEDEDKGEEKGEGKGKEEVFYVEAGVDVENPGSQVVLRKLGFKSVGVRVEKEKAWLNGAWRGPEWWICGQFL